MKLLKAILKIIAGLCIGGLAGLLIGGLLSVLLTDTSLSEYLLKFSSVNLGEGALAASVAVVSLLVSVPLLIIIHEGGHLVCGLLTGYSFVSFRIFNFTFIKVDGKIRVKRFSLAGTGGQCLLSPPDLPFDKIPTSLYNMGGVLANLIVFFIALPFLFLDPHPLAVVFIVIFILIDLIMILMNGIPFQAGGIGNDAFNMQLLRKNKSSKRGLAIQLLSNAMIQEGVRPKDMPREWFKIPAEIDYKNAFDVSLPLMAASRLLDEEKLEDAYHAFNQLYLHKDEIMGLYVKEIACELAFCAMATGRTKLAEELLDKDLMKYIEMYRKTMSSKERILCAYNLFIKHDRKAAVDVYEQLLKRSSDYLLQGEVKSDLAIMKSILAENGN